MKKRISYIDPIQLGKVSAVLYACLTLIFVPFVLVILLIGATQPHNNHMMPSGMVFPLVAIVLIPLFYAFLGFIFGIVGAFVYNIVAGWTGGIEFILADVAPEYGAGVQPGRIPM